MGVHINTDNLLNTVIPYLKQCKQKLKDCKTNLQSAEKVQIILPGIEGATEIQNSLDRISTGVREILEYLESNIDEIKELTGWIKNKVDAFDNADDFGCRTADAQSCDTLSIAGAAAGKTNVFNDTIFECKINFAGAYAARGKCISCHLHPTFLFLQQ